jgi:hypothetical protein
LSLSFFTELPVWIEKTPKVHSWGFHERENEYKKFRREEVRDQVYNKITGVKEKNGEDEKEKSGRQMQTGRSSVCKFEL